VSILPINPEQLDESTDVVHKTSQHRAVAAAFFSALIPGSGQFLLRQHAKGGTLLGSLIALVLCFWPLRLPRFYFAFMFLCWCCIGLYVYAACSPIWSGHVGSRRPPRWWLALIVPTTLVMLWLVGNGGMHAARVFDFSSFLRPRWNLPFIKGIALSLI
jgi:TM2 domain-containing membrane protein YozV